MNLKRGKKLDKIVQGFHKQIRIIYADPDYLKYQEKKHQEFIDACYKIAGIIKTRSEK